MMKTVLYALSFLAAVILMTSCPGTEYGCPPYCNDTCCCGDCDLDTCDPEYCEGCCCKEGIECLVDTCNNNPDFECWGCCCEVGIDCYMDTCREEYCNQTGSFEVFLGGYGEDQGWSILKSTEGTLALTGRYSELTDMNYDIWLGKIDSTGKLLWARHSIYGNVDDEYAVDLIELSDRDLVVLANKAKNGTDNQIYLVRTDKDGIPRWVKDYGPFSDDQGWSVTSVSNDLSYLVAGSSDIYKSFKGWEAMIWEVKNDGVPEIRWNFGTGGDDYACCIEVDRDGNYLLLSVIEKENGGCKLTLDKLNKNMSGLIWESEIVSSCLPGHRACISTIEHSNGTTEQADYVIAAAVLTGEMRITLVNADGTLSDYATYTDITFTGSVSVIPAADGGFAVLTDEMLLVKLSAGLSVEWTRDFSGESHGVHSLLQSGDGGFIMIGTKYNEATASNDIYVVKTDQEGKL